MSGEILAAVVAEAQRVREGCANPPPWHIVFPARYLPHAERLKESYLRLGAHGINGLCGIRFTEEWPVIGQVFTYDIATGAWDR